MATTVCGKLLNSLFVDCNNPSVAGIDDYIYLYNKSDLSFTYSATDPGVVTALTMATGTSGHAVQGINNIFLATSKLVQIEAGPRWELGVDFKIMRNDAKTKAIIRALSWGRIVAIVENLSKGGDAQFEIFGASVGLICGDVERNSSDENSAGAYTVKLTRPKNLREPGPPLTFQMQLTNVYDYPTTKAGLLATIPAPVGTSVVVEP